MRDVTSDMIIKLADGVVLQRTDYWKIPDGDTVEQHKPALRLQQFDLIIRDSGISSDRAKQAKIDRFRAH